MSANIQFPDKCIIHHILIIFNYPCQYLKLLARPNQVCTVRFTPQSHRENFPPSPPDKAVSKDDMGI